MPEQCPGPPVGSLPFEKEEINHTIPERFGRIVCHYPDRLAIKNGRDALTYRELDNVSNQIAHAILFQRPPDPEPIVLLLDSGVTLLAAIVGVLKTGKFYVVLDPASLQASLTGILEHTQAGLIITNRQHDSLAAKLAQQRQVLNLDALPTPASYEKLDLPISSDSLAALFYTSGSTGQPKAVERTHRSILYSVWQDTTNYQIGFEDRHTLLFSCAFASSMRSIFNSWLNGAVVCPLNILNVGPKHMINWLHDEEITLLHPPISLFRQLLDLLSEEDRFPKLRLIFLADMYPHDVARVKRHVSESCHLIHQMVSTEAGVLTHFPINPHADVFNSSIPAGYMIGEREMFLLDDSGQQVEVDQVGEIAVRSRYLAPGYWRNPELTQQKFLPDPEGGDQRIYLTGDLGRMRPDGCLEYLGRKDAQVKIRGYTVELRSVEVVLNALPIIKEAVVLVKTDPRGERHLVAYLVPATQSAPTVNEIRRALDGQLAGYMIPSRLIILDALPLTPTGKVDRNALPQPTVSRPELTTPFLAPGNDLERQLTQICEEVLGIHPVGMNDDFFDLGGNSLLFVRFLSEIEDRIGTTLSVNAMLPSPTIAHIAAMLSPREKNTSKANLLVTPKRYEGYNPLRLLFRLLRLPYLPWSKKVSRSREIVRQTLLKHGPIFGNVVLPYSLGTRFLAWFCGNRFIQATVFRQEVQTFQAFQRVMNRSSRETEVIQHHLAANFWKHWRIHALARCTPQQFESWVTISGQSMLQQIHEQRRGVILLNSHFVLNQVNHLVLQSLGLFDYQAIGSPVFQAETTFFRRMRLSSGHKAKKRAFLHILRQYHEGRKMLKKGGIMLIGGDGMTGDHRMFLSFHGRLMEFKTGFAEAAAAHTRAAVIPVFVSLQPTGHVHIDMLEPLDTGTPEMSHGQRVEWLMQQYVTLLETRWKQEPQNLAWGMIERFLASPPLVSNSGKKVNNFLDAAH